MNLRPERQKVGGSVVHIGDPHIWATISYLDSTTAYREYLPKAEQQRLIAQSEMVMLDKSDRVSVGQAITAVAFAVSLLLVLVLHFCS